MYWTDSSYQNSNCYSLPPVFTEYQPSIIIVETFYPYIEKIRSSKLGVTARTRCMQLALFREAQNQYLYRRKSSIVVSTLHRDSSISFMSLSLPQGYGSLHKLSSRSQYRRSSPETIGATPTISAASVSHLMIY